MIAELTVQHAYIEGGDFQNPPRPRVGLPGARFELDKQSGRYRISKIFEGENEEDIYRSPLREIGVNVSVGDYVLAIDGEELKGNDDPYRLLRNKADNPVSLTVNSKPTMDGSRTISYRPITDETNLIYLDWVEVIASALPMPPAGVWATFTFRTWAPTASANSSSGITRRSTKKVWWLTLGQRRRQRVAHVD
jgi:hypothetical protein